MILITGGTGFVGLNTGSCLADGGESVVLTARSRAAQESLPISRDGITIEVIDLTTWSKLRFAPRGPRSGDPPPTNARQAGGRHGLTNERVIQWQSQ